MKYFEKMLKKMDAFDIGLVKIAVFAFALWLVALLPGFAIWVMSTNHWLFLIIYIIACARPMIKIFSKK